MNDAKVSIIVPVYNTYEYLSKCLDSVIGQSLTEIEIIVINDGSPDDSDSIIRAYIEKDDRIIYIIQENKGLGVTRNIGIEKASGEYIAFVDSDDYIEPDMMQRMYEKASQADYDVVICETYINDGERQCLRKSLADIDEDLINRYDTRDFLKNVFFTNIYRYCSWDKIYKTSFIKKNKILFGDNREIYAEDAYFQFRVIMEKPLLGFVARPLYHYVQREGSITGSVRTSFMKRHLRLQNILYEEGGSRFSPMVDIMLFRGLLNEASYSVKYNLGKRAFLQSMDTFYKDKSFTRFIVSVRENKTADLLSNSKRRQLFVLFAFLLRIKAMKAAAFLIYLTAK